MSRIEQNATTTVTATRAGTELAEFAPVAPQSLARYIGKAQQSGADTIRVTNQWGLGYTLHPQKG